MGVVVTGATTSRVLVTGANGFVGRTLVTRLMEGGYSLRRAVRRAEAAGVAETVVTGEIGPDTDWTAALRQIDVVVHLAARVHVMRERSRDPLAEFRRVNYDGTRQLARAAVMAGVRRFIYISTVKVHGEATECRPVDETNAPAPADAYARSKWEAEEFLNELASERGLELVVLRPPLVYGPGVGGNFLRLMELVARGVPLPLGGIENQRSFVGLTNLTDLVARCIHHPAAAGQTFLVADGEDVSTPDLVRRLGTALGRRVRLIAVPERMLRAASWVPGFAASYRRLCGSLQVDASRSRSLLSWAPSSTMDAELERMGTWYMAMAGHR